MSIIFQDQETVEKLIEKATELKEACGKIGEAKEACEAVESALAKLAEAEDDELLASLELLGKAVRLLKKWAPEGAGAFFQAYADALQAISKALATIALTPYDKALDRAFDETGKLDEALKLVDRILPDAQAADRTRAIKRVQTRIQQAELKMQGCKPSKRWYESELLPWNWFGFAPSRTRGTAGRLAGAGTGAGLVMLTALAIAHNQSPKLDVEVKPIGTQFDGYLVVVNSTDFGGCELTTIDVIPCSIGPASSLESRAAAGPLLSAVPPRSPLDWRPCRNVRIIGNDYLAIDNDGDGFCDELINSWGEHFDISRDSVQEMLEALFGPSGSREAFQRFLDWYIVPSDPEPPRRYVEPVEPLRGLLPGGPLVVKPLGPSIPYEPPCGGAECDDGTGECQGDDCPSHPFPATPSCTDDRSGCTGHCDGESSSGPPGCNGSCQPPAPLPTPNTKPAPNSTPSGSTNTAPPAPANPGPQHLPSPKPAPLPPVDGGSGGVGANPMPPVPPTVDTAPITH